MAALSEHTGLEIRSLVKSDGELVLTLTRAPIPEPEADEVVIRVEATPINPSDMGWLFGSGAADRAGGNSAEDTRQFFTQGVLRQADTIDDNFGFDFRAFPDPFNAPFARTSSVVPSSAAQGSNIITTGLFAIDDRQTLQVKYLRRRVEDVGFPDFQPPAFFQRVSLPHNNVDRVSARYEARHLAPWLASVKVATYFQDQKRLLRNEFPVQFPVPSPRFFPINVYRLDLVTDTGQHVQTPGLDAQATMIVARTHAVTAGAMVYRDRSEDSRTNVSQMSLIGSVDLGPGGPEATALPASVPVGSPSTTHPVRVPNASFSDAGLFQVLPGILGRICGAGSIS